MKPLLTISAFTPKLGGPYTVIKNLAENLSDSLPEVSILTSSATNNDSRQESDTKYKIQTIVPKSIHIANTRLTWGLGRQVSDFISEYKPDVIHDNGIWLMMNHHVAKKAALDAIPRILSAHGSLDTWSLRHRGLKKKIALHLYQQADLESATCLQANSVQEAENLRIFGVKQPIALIPNGVDVPSVCASPGSNQKRTILFMGRLHPIKNVDLFLKSLATLPRKDWRFLVAGPDEGGHQKELENLVRELGLGELVEFIGPVSGAEKEALFLKSDALCLVSKTENFGISAAEAMSYGLPVIASHETPWACLETEKMGWHVPSEVPALSCAIIELLEAEPALLMEMGQRARAYASQHYSWASLTAAYLALYQWVCGQGERPDSIVSL